MKRNLILSWVLALSLRSLAAANDEIPQPCRIQSVEDQLRCVAPQGYNVRSGDCPGNDIWSLYRDQTTLEDCARLCSSSSQCLAFMFYNNHRCYPKTKTCDTTTKTNPLNVFYDKVPSGYTMRQGDCSGNDIWSLFRDRTTLADCAGLCSSSSQCQAFMFYNNHRCYPKTKTCGTTSKTNPLNVFYDKVPSGYTMRPGDCSGNDIRSLYRDSTTLADCASLCSSSSQCLAFMFYDNHRCYPKTKSCATTNTTNSLNIFYDKVPVGYTMRPGDCSGNDIWSIHGFVSLAECAKRCNNNPTCVSFMLFDGRECYPKTKTCETTDTANPKNFFYDKIVLI